MSFADHIRACNNFDRGRVVPLLAGGRRVGWLRHDNAAALARFDSVFAVEPQQVRLVVEGDADTNSAAVDDVAEALVIEKGVPQRCMETELGIRDDVLFAYDLELPAEFEPKNSDGEIVHFELMPAADVVERVRATDDFKFNVNLVILDFALRHGLIPVEYPEYLDIASGLHRPLD